jgi:SAM-dependent methyltransferase
MHLFERQDFVVADFQATGYILDIGGGGEGIIGQMKPTQVIAIDLSKRELEEAPAGPLKIVMDATNLKFLDASFDTATAFFSLMYMRPEVQQRVFAEVFRVLTRGGRWIIWDAVIPRAFENDARPSVPVPLPASRQDGPDGLRHVLARESDGPELLQAAGAGDGVRNRQGRTASWGLRDPRPRTPEGVSSATRTR